jgi:hypothetical protein
MLRLMYQCKANGRRYWGQLTEGWLKQWQIGGSIVERARLLECDDVSSDKQFLIFQRIRVPSQCWEVFMWWCVIRQAVPDISKDQSAFTVLEVFMRWCVIRQAVPGISKDQSAFTVLWGVHVMMCHQTSSSWYFKGSGCLHSVGKCSCGDVSSDKQFLIFHRTRVPSQCWEVFIQWHSVTSQTWIFTEGTV